MGAYGPRLGDTSLAREELGMEFHSLEDTLRAASDGQWGHFRVAQFVCLVVILVQYTGVHGNDLAAHGY